MFPALLGQTVIVRGHLSCGNTLVPGSLLGQRLRARATAWQDGDSASEEQEEGWVPFPLQSEEEGRFQVGCHSVTAVTVELVGP